MRTHEEFREALGAYAINAVDPAERASIERHLHGCEECLSEVSAHLQAAAALAGPDVSPPDAVWQGIRAAITVHTGPQRATRRRAWRLVPALAAALALVGFLGWRVVDLDGRLDRVGRGGLAAAAEAARTNPAARTLDLRSTDAGLTVRVVLLPDGTGFVVEDNLPPLPATGTYQLWSLVDGRAISAGVLGADPGIAAFRVPAGAGGLAITEERAGGAQIPALPAVAEANLHTV